MGTKKVTSLQLINGAEKATVRGKRRRVDQIPPMTRRVLPEQFEIRGAGAGSELAEVHEAQWSAVIELLVHHLYKDVREIKSALIMRGAESPNRKGPQRESRLRIVRPEEAA